MTFEQMEAKLTLEGWHVWHLGKNSQGVWSCRLWCEDVSLRRTPRGPAGYDRDEMWRQGCGPTAVAAMSAAATAIALPQSQPSMEEALDLAKMLG